MSDWKDRATKVDSTNDWKSRAQPVQPSDEADTNLLNTGVAQVAAGATGGFDDELAGGLSYLGRIAGIKGLGGKIKDVGLADDGPTLDIDKLKQAYVDTRDQLRAMKDAQQEAHPVISTVANVGGMLANPIMGGEAGLAKLTALGAVQGLGDSKADLTTGDSDQYIQAAKDTGMGGAIGLGTGVAAKAAGAGLKYAGGKISGMAPDVVDYLTKKFGKIAANIPEEYTGEYLARKGNIEARPTNEIMDELSGHYADAENSLNNAKDSLNQSKLNLSDTKSDLTNGLQDTRFQLGNALSDSKDALNQAIQGQKEKLANSNVMHLKEPIQDSISQLHEQVSEGSSKAFKILDNTKGTVDIQPILENLASKMKDLQINGTPISDTAANSVKNLNALGERLANLGNDVTFPQAKRIIQQLDGDIQFSQNLGAFAPEADAAKAAIRQQFDGILKNAVPEYETQMEKVAEKTELLAQMSKGFGTETSVINRLNNIATEKGAQVDLPLLKQLGQHTGQDFSTPIEQHLANVDTLNSPSKMQALKEAMPEFQQHQNLSDAYDQMLNPETRRGIEQTPEMLSANNQLSQSQTALDAAQDKFKGLQSLNPNQVQSKVKALTGQRNYGAENIFDNVDKITGQNYSQEIKDRAILDSFSKQDQTGARKTLLGTAIGTGIGSLIGHPFLGAQIGAAAGASADKYAGVAFQKMLDGQIAIGQAMPVVAEKLGPYTKVLSDAATRGPQALAATHFILQQTDSNYRDRINQMNGSQNGR